MVRLPFFFLYESVHQITAGLLAQSAMRSDFHCLNFYLTMQAEEPSIPSVAVFQNPAAAGT